MQHFYIPVIVLYPELTPYFMTHDDYYRYIIVLLFLGQLKMYKDDSDMRYMIYMSVCLFGLST